MITRHLIDRWQQFLDEHLQLLPTEISITNFDNMTIDQLWPIVNKYPVLRKFYTHPKVRDVFVPVEELSCMSDERFLKTRTAVDDNYGVCIVAQTHRMLMRILLARLGKARRVFDFCCGWGTYPTFLLSKAGYTGEITGSDGSWTMLENAERLMKANGVKYALRHAYADSLPFGDGSFDFAFCFDAFQYVRHWREAIAELSRVIENEGRFLLSYPLGFPRQNIPIAVMVNELQTVGLSPLDVIELPPIALYGRTIIYGYRDRGWG